VKLYTIKRQGGGDLTPERLRERWEEDRTCPSSGSGHHYYTRRVLLFGFIPWTLACRCGRWL
jgi:hypothetical protein